MGLKTELDEGKRLLNLAERSHAETGHQGEATQWYLRAIAHLLVALCESKSENSRQSGRMSP